MITLICAGEQIGTMEAGILPLNGDIISKDGALYVVINRVFQGEIIDIYTRAIDPLKVDRF